MIYGWTIIIVPCTNLGHLENRYILNLPTIIDIMIMMPRPKITDTNHANQTICDMSTYVAVSLYFLAVAWELMYTFVTQSNYELRVISSDMRPIACQLSKSL